MYKYLMLGVLLLSVPATGFSAPFENILKEALQLKEKPAGNIQNKRARPGLKLALSDFQIKRSGSKTYWFATLENSSSLEAGKRQLEVSARQYGANDQSSTAGAPILNTMPLRAGDSLNLQREFEPADGVSRIRIEVRDRNQNRLLVSETFQADMRRVKPVTRPREKSVAFSAKMQARIRADNDNYLWYVEIKNVGRGTLFFKDYDFRITPSIRGVQTGREPFTDVAGFDERSVEPGKISKIYLATGYDSCFSGDLITVNITHRTSGRVINLYQPVTEPLYPLKMGSNVFKSPGVLTYWDFEFEIPVKDDDLPPYYNGGVFYGDVLAKHKKRGRHQFSFNYVKHVVGLKLPPELMISDATESVTVDLKWFASFCGRQVLIKEGRRTFDGDALRDAEHGATLDLP
ncbi:MAG: hypothetical protein ABW146_13085 [Candidatus Sedimenticola sp. 6PFRAG7]